jgi:hypothetical protein
MVTFLGEPVHQCAAKALVTANLEALKAPFPEKA